MPPGETAAEAGATDQQRRRDRPARSRRRVQRVTVAAGSSLSALVSEGLLPERRPEQRRRLSVDLHGAARARIGLEHRLHPAHRLGIELAVDVGDEQGLGVAHHPLLGRPRPLVSGRIVASPCRWSPSRSWSSLRPRASRLITVPIGMPNTSAVSR